LAVELVRKPKVEADGLGVADMEKPVRFWREASLDRAAESVGRDIGRDHLSHEILAGNSVVGHGGK
jgi:hypothetical protein